MKGLNLANMKKIHQDDKSATFRHKDGHQIKVAVSALSPKMKDELKNLPIHQADPKADDLNFVDLQDSPTQAQPQVPPYLAPNPEGPAAPASPNIDTDIGNLSQQLAKYPEGQERRHEIAEQNKRLGVFQDKNQQQPVPQPVQDMDQSSPAQAEPAAPEPSQPPVDWNKMYGSNPDNKVQAVQQTPPPPQNMQQGLLSEDAEMAQDMKNGAIPYQKMFANDSTLSRIGTIFGLLIGGAGAGLSHQPNALLEMMNKELDRDQQSKLQGKRNALDLYRMHQEKQLQNAQIQQMGVHNQLTQQQIANAKQELNFRQNAFDRMAQNRAVVQHLTDIVNKYPPNSPDYQKASNQLAMLSQVVDAQNFNLASVAQAKAEFFKRLNPETGGQQQPSGEQQFQQRQGMLPMLGEQGTQRQKYETERHIPGVPGSASRPIPEDIRNKVQAMNVLDNKGRDVLNYINQNYATMNPQKRAVAEQKIEEMKNFYNDSIKGGALTQGRLGWYDEQFAKHPTDILANFMGSTAKLKEMVDSNANRKNMELQGLGFPVKNPQQRQSQNPGEIRYDEQGNAWKLGPNGQPQRVR